MDKKDEELTERKALKRAAKEGIEFVDAFTIADDPDQVVYDTRKEAEAKAEGRSVVQHRWQKPA